MTYEINLYAQSSYAKTFTAFPIGRFFKNGFFLDGGVCFWITRIKSRTLLINHFEVLRKIKKCISLFCWDNSLTKTNGRLQSQSGEAACRKSLSGESNGLKKKKDQANSLAKIWQRIFVDFYRILSKRDTLYTEEVSLVKSLKFI